jgi:hypothetical protein
MTRPRKPGDDGEDPTPREDQELALELGDQRQREKADESSFKEWDPLTRSLKVPKP